MESTSIYSTNAQKLVLNSKDFIFAQEAASNDPVIEYSLLGETIEDGVFGWVAFGINLTRHAAIHAAVTLTEKGGVAAPGGGGFPGGPPPSGFPGAPVPPSSTAMSLASTASDNAAAR